MAELPIIWWVAIGLSGFSLLLVLIVVSLWKSLGREKFRKRQLSVRYGKMTEQFLPLASQYPWDPGKFRFLGSPIDGIQFNETEVVLVEFKSSQSKLSPTQNRIKELVKKGKVSFREVRVS